MNGATDLQTLLATLRPNLVPGEFVFVTRPDATYGDEAELKPIAAFLESEGLTLVIPKHLAENNGLQCSSDFRLITLQVHSDLSAVGLTSKIAETLSSQGISANIIAAYHHDHVFVPSSRADEALGALNKLASAVANTNPASSDRADKLQPHGPCN